MGFKEKIKAEFDSADAIINLAERESRALTAEELAKYEGHLNNVETLQKQAKEFETLKAKRSQLNVPEARKGISQPNASIEVMEPEFKKDANCGFASHRDFLKAIIDNAKTGATDERLQYLGTLGTDEHQVQDNSYAGFLIPKGFVAGVSSMAVEADPSIGKTMMMPMAQSTVEISAIVDKNHSSSVSGGLTVTRTPEATAASASRIKFEQIVMKANEQTGVAFATKRLLAESPVSFAALLDAQFAKEFASKNFQEKLTGSGTGEFLGVTNSAAFISVAKESGQTADTIVEENIYKMYSRFYGSNGMWITSKTCIPQLCALNANNTNLFVNNIALGMPMTLFGLPIVFSEYAPIVGDANDIILVDWSQCYEAEYMPLTQASSSHVRFLEREECFLFSRFNDFKPAWTSALTPKKGSTLSPFVGLDARA